ncbi:response regulator transcription factor [Bacillus sp. NSP9.1]|uniref:response regulator transcription factor n=1 Tax=Bacillus sp. NSP9.1 TaxID=1071078 RepID=UPI001F478BCF|nr:response regulator transcription factor [Bacillus sp. NSP9.1]
MINLLLIEDDVYWLDNIKKFLEDESDIKVVGEIIGRKNLNNFLASNIDIDVILLDIELEGDLANGINTCYDIMKKKENTNVIIQASNNMNAELIKKAFTAGAIDFIFKKNYKDLPNKVRYANSPFNPYKILLSEYSKLKRESILSQLSPAEKELYKLICKGHSRANISKILFKSPNTIKKQIKSIFKKTGYKTTQELREHLSWSTWKKHH